MGRRKKEIKEEVVEVEKVVEEPVKEVIKEKEPVKTEFSVYSGKGDFVRTYSVEIHGEGAEELAKGFANKVNGLIK